MHFTESQALITRYRISRKLWKQARIPHCRGYFSELRKILRNLGRNPPFKSDGRAVHPYFYNGTVAYTATPKQKNAHKESMSFALEVKSWTKLTLNRRENGAQEKQ